MKFFWGDDTAEVYKDETSRAFSKTAMRTEVNLPVEFYSGTVVRTFLEAVKRAKAGPPIEVRSGAIIPSATPGLYFVEVNTAQGLRKFRNAEDVTGRDVQSEVDPTRIEFLSEWRTQRAHLRDTGVEVTKRALQTHAKLESHEARSLTSDVVLRMFYGVQTTPSQRRTFIINAEALDFSIDQAATLTPLLRKFIDEHRESNDPADLVAVGSAIRTFIANASADEAFAYTASLLKTGGRTSLPIDLELELAKMVVRKLTTRSPAVEGNYPEVSACLKELAETYLNPRLLSREKHGAVALNAVFGLILARSGHVDEVISKVGHLGVPWFQQLVARRASRLKTELECRGSDSADEGVLRHLARLFAESSLSTSK